MYGFRNLQNLVRKIKLGKGDYHFVEVMACPGGCLNGGGQLSREESMSGKEWLQHVDNVYRNIDSKSPEENTQALSVIQEWLGGLNTPKAQQLLWTDFHEVEKINKLETNW